MRHGLTIRQALWISRLYAFINPSRKIELLWLASYVYSVFELQLGTKANTWQLDRALRQGETEFRLLGMNIVDSSFEAEFQLHMASEHVRELKLKTREDIFKEARERLNAGTLRATTLEEQLQSNSKDGEK